MTSFPDAMKEKDLINQEVRNYIDASLCSLQQARPDKRNTATLEDLFKSRNPYLLRSTRKVASQLVRYCLDNYLLSADEIYFANFLRELSTFTARRSRQILEPSAIIELFAQDALPLRIELLTAYDRAINRLTHQFYVELCDEDANIDWERLARFIFSFEKHVHSQEAVGNS